MISLEPWKWANQRTTAGDDARIKEAIGRAELGEIRPRPEPGNGKEKKTKGQRLPAAQGQPAARQGRQGGKKDEWRMIHIDNWHNCYDNGWKGLLWEDKESGESAFCHPAKMSKSLVFKIVEHLLEEGWIQPGQTVLDPFGGVGTTALPALMAGLNYVGVELEEKFVTLGRKNIELWQGRFSGMPKWTGSAQLIQGDSRRLAEIVAAAGCVVSSPPYCDQPTQTGKVDVTKWSNGKIRPIGASQRESGGYGQTPGQLAALPPGSPALISSPPFAGNTGGRGEASRNGIDAALFDRHSGGMKKGTGSDPANLDNLRMGAAPGGGYALVGSPPFEGSLDRGTVNKQMRVDYARKNGIDTAAKVSPIDMEKIGGRTQPDYGSTPGQIGNDSGETFWTAARLILEQCALLLPPGAPAVWVVKNYIKGGREVDFSGQWQALCEACGFETIHIHRAWLIKNQGTKQATMDGDSVSKEVARKSFFRRLHERKNPHLAIDWEIVLCTVRR